MIRVILCLVLALNASGAFAEGKPCGNSYIAKEKECHKDTPVEHRVDSQKKHITGSITIISKIPNPAPEPLTNYAPYFAIYGLLFFWWYLRKVRKAIF